MLHLPQKELGSTSQRSTDGEELFLFQVEEEERQKRERGLAATDGAEGRR